MNGSQEQLVESLIKMVGRANQKVDVLQKRISQLEWLFKEHELELKERGPIRIYSTLPPSHTSSSETH